MKVIGDLVAHFLLNVMIWCGKLLFDEVDVYARGEVLYSVTFKYSDRSKHG